MKSLTLVLCVIAILGAAASAYFWVEIGKTKEVLKQEVSNAQKSTAEVQAKLADSTTKGQALEKSLAESDSNLGEAKLRASKAEATNTQISRDVAQLRNQITAKDDAASTLNTEISQLKRELAQAKLSASAATPEEVEGYKSTIASLQAKVTDLEAGRGTVVAGGSTSTTAGSTGTTVPSAPAGLSGQVASIGAQNGFVVLNIGSAQGVQVNQRFNITRSGAVVASAVISSVQPNLAIAQITADSLRSGLNKGDTAVISQ